MIPLEKKEKIYEQCLVACLFHKNEIFSRSGGHSDRDSYLSLKVYLKALYYLSKV